MSRKPALAPVFQGVDNAIRWINLYMVDSVVNFVEIYPHG